jgi:hypothetical protein
VQPEAPLLGWKLPAPQAQQVPAPVAAAYRPTPQLTQPAAPEVAWKWPALQPVQLGLPPAL